MQVIPPNGLDSFEIKKQNPKIESGTFTFHGSFLKKAVQIFEKNIS